MNIKSMLMRLQGALGLADLAELVLLPGRNQTVMQGVGDRHPINLVVGYTGSPESHTALDLALWIAHQTRLVTSVTVTVHAVYVIEPDTDGYFGQLNSTWTNEFAFAHHDRPVSSPNQSLQRTFPSKLEPTHISITQATLPALTVLQQACQLAQEWGGAFDTHLTFGNIVAGLKTVVEAEEHVLLVLGCCSLEHPIVQQLQTEVHCPVLGIPKNHVRSQSQ